MTMDVSETLDLAFNDLPPIDVAERRLADAVFGTDPDAYLVALAEAKEARALDAVRQGHVSGNYPHLHLRHPSLNPVAIAEMDKAIQSIGIDTAPTWPRFLGSVDTRPGGALCRDNVISPARLALRSLWARWRNPSPETV